MFYGTLNESGKDSNYRNILKILNTQYLSKLKGIISKEIDNFKYIKLLANHNGDYDFMYNNKTDKYYLNYIESSNYGTMKEEKEDKIKSSNEYVNDMISLSKAIQSKIKPLGFEVILETEKGMTAEKYKEFANKQFKNGSMPVMGLCIIICPTDKLLKSLNVE